MVIKRPTFYLNENIPVRVVNILARFKIASIHTIDAGNKGTTDEFQLKYASRKNAILVSHNIKHFKRLHKQWLQRGLTHSGILVLGHGESEYLAHRIRRFTEEVYHGATSPFCINPPK